LQATAMAELFDDDLAQKLADSRRELLDEYRQSHAHPWIIGYVEAGFAEFGPLLAFRDWLSPHKSL
jgi:hypothetical protein